MVIFEFTKTFIYAEHTDGTDAVPPCVERRCAVRAPCSNMWFSVNLSMCSACSSVRPPLRFDFDLSTVSNALRPYVNVDMVRSASVRGKPSVNK